MGNGILVRTVQRSGDSLVIGIPSEIVKALEIKEKDPLMIKRENGNIVISKLKK